MSVFRVKGLHMQTYTYIHAYVPHATYIACVHAYMHISYVRTAYRHKDITHLYLIYIVAYLPSYLPSNLAT